MVPLLDDPALNNGRFKMAVRASRMGNNDQLVITGTGSSLRPPAARRSAELYGRSPLSGLCALPAINSP